MAKPKCVTQGCSYPGEVEVSGRAVNPLNPSEVLNVKTSLCAYCARKYFGDLIGLFSIGER